jgi:hypothetical protein
LLHNEACPSRASGEPRGRPLPEEALRRGVNSSGTTVPTRNWARVRSRPLGRRSLDLNRTRQLVLGCLLAMIRSVGGTPNYGTRHIPLQKINRTEPLHSHPALTVTLRSVHSATKQKTEPLCSRLPNTEQSGSVPRIRDGTAPIYLAPQPNTTLVEVMKTKRFPGRWCDWVMNNVGNERCV